MAIRLGRRGVFYTAISLLIVGILVLAFRPRAYEASVERLDVEHSRVELANTLVRTIEEGLLQRIAIVTASRALNAMALYVQGHGTYGRDEFQQNFEEVMLTGRLGGLPIDQHIGQNIMTNNSLADSLRMLEQVAYNSTHLMLRFNLTNARARVFQSNESGYESVIVNLTLGFSLDAGTARWDKRGSWTAKVPVQHLYDPLWIVWGNRTIPIIFADYEINYTRDWRSLFNFIDKVHYTREPAAPSYLMRFWGEWNGSSECCGIESAVNPYFLNITTAYNRTYIDFCWVSPNICAPYAINSTLYRIANITSRNRYQKFYEFKLDARHYVKFGVFGGNGTTGSTGDTPTGGPAVGQVRCELNTQGNWSDCRFAQWLTTIRRVRAECLHSAGANKIVSASFRLWNEDDGVVYFDVTNSSGLGTWYYNTPDVLINESGDWRLRVICRDNAGKTASNTIRWLVPWGLAEIRFYEQEGNIIALVSCTRGECGEIGVRLWD